MRDFVVKITQLSLKTLLVQVVILCLLPLLFVICESFAIIPAGTSSHYLLDSYCVAILLDIAGAVLVLALNVVNDFKN